MKDLEKMWDLYHKYYTSRDFEREEVFQALKDRFNVKSVLYPGSFVHITPSFVIEKSVYVDSDSGAKKFFNNTTLVSEIIESRKNYLEKPIFKFYGQSYNKSIQIELESFDLLISHYAGIISQPCKKYLKIGGLLLVNNSHADAGVAFLDPDYKLIATIEPNRKNVISTKDLGKYFSPKKNTSIKINDLIHSGKGIGYTHTASLYLFERIK